MIRTQIQLTEKQTQLLKAMSKQHRVSMAELIRRSIDKYLRTEGPVNGDEERRRRLMSIVGGGHSGLTDVAENHDKYLAEAFYDWHDKEKQRGDIH